VTSGDASIAVRDPLLTVAQVGVILGKSRAWIFRELKSKRLVGVKIGAARRFRLSDVEAYIAQLQPDIPQGPTETPDAAQNRGWNSPRPA
jgi:excisionase family DNA binding protein